MLHSLPTDLQICIVHSWLAGDERELLQALSRLICSSSSKAREEDLLSLTSHSSDHWTATAIGDGIPGTGHGVKALPDLLRWLHRWAVPMKVLDLSTMESSAEQLLFQLPSVETIYLTMKPIGSIGWILPHLPNLTAIHCVDRHSDNALIWTALQKLPLKLKVFTALRWNDSQSLCALVQTFGQHLEVLKVYVSIDVNGDAIDKLQVIAQCCPHLRVLHVPDCCDAPAILKLLSACLDLTDLSLGVNGHVGDLTSILTNKQVKRFYLLGYDDNFNEEEDEDHPPNIGYDLFGEIVAEHPALERFKMPTDCEYDRSTGYLCIYSELLYFEEELQAVFQQCRPLRKIKLLIGDRPVDGRMLTLICSELGDDVEELELSAFQGRNFTADQLLSIPLRCPQLRKLVMDAHCYSLLSDASLHALAAACPLLQELSCEGIEAGSSFTDDGMQALFKGCAGLQVLRIDMAIMLTFHTLQTIVDCRLCLKSLTVRLHKLTEDDFLQFRQLVKDARLLPVVKIVKLSFL